jgi:enediyne polyketide synthase
VIDIRRTELGKPELHLDGVARLGVSLTQDNRYCIAVAGDGAQGVDIQVVSERSQAEWNALVGPQHHTLLADLAGSEPLARAGTRIWTARECAYKALGARTAVLSILNRAGDALLLHARADDGTACEILSMPMTMTLGRERVLAVVVESEGEEHEQRSEPVPASLLAISRRAAAALEIAGFDLATYSMSADEATGELVLRWPLGFKEGTNLDRSVSFTHYFDWMGRVREIAMQPVLRPFVAQMATGRWGMVTNSSWLRVLGEPRLGDTIEVRYSTQRAPRQPESTLDLRFDWRRLDWDGHQERVALGQMRVAWVALVGHGQVRAEPFPDYFRSFIDARTPPGEGDLLTRACKEPLASLQLDLGIQRYRRAEGPRRGPTIASHVFETCLQDANVVGNIYFANYYVWQARLVDQYLHRLIPNVYGAAGGLGELRCLRAQVEHFMESMPFDAIEVIMSLEALHDNGITFGFEYFRVQPDGSRQKVALGEQESIWLVRRDGAPAAGFLPDPLMADLRERIG